MNHGGIRPQIKYYLVLSAGQVNQSNNTLCSSLYQNNSEGFEQAQHLIAINWKSYKYATY